MKTSKRFLSLVTVFFSVALLASCSSDDDNGGINPPPDNGASCYVQLFDGNNFKDDSIMVEGPGEYADLSDLPNADGTDWTDEADSFKVGDSTTLTVWTETNFQGDSTVYEAGEYPSVDEPYSMKIVCHDDGNDDDNPEAGN